MKKIVQEIPIIILKGENCSNVCTFFDIHQKIANKTRIFLHFVPKIGRKPLPLQAVNKYQ